MNKIKLCIISLIVGFVSPTLYASECPTILGTKIKPRSFEDVKTLFKSLPKKDEFETTASYESRLKDFASSLPNDLIVSIPIDHKYITYDADNRALKFEQYALSNIRGDYITAMFMTPYDKILKPSLIDNAALVVKSTDKKVGTFAAGNAYGANVTVTKFITSLDAIFDIGNSKVFVEQSSSNSQQKGPLIWGVAMEPDEARKVRPQLRAAALISPKPPYYFESKNTSVFNKITVQNPRDFEQHSRIIVAGIKCVLVLDAGGQVILSQVSSSGNR